MNNTINIVNQNSFHSENDVAFNIDYLKAKEKNYRLQIFY